MLAPKTVIQKKDESQLTNNVIFFLNKIKLVFVISNVYLFVLHLKKN